jgi:UDP-glucose 4-epimerase
MEQQINLHNLSESQVMEDYVDSAASSPPGSPLSMCTVSPLTTPDLSDDGLDTDRLPEPLIDSRDSDEGANAQPYQLLPEASPSFVLVIGGLGYIGSHTVLELLREGFNGSCGCQRRCGWP